MKWTQLTAGVIFLGGCVSAWGATNVRVSVSSAGIQGNGISFRTALSGDGRYVAFVSEANNLVPGDTNGVRDVFVYDNQTLQTERVSVSTAGTQGDAYSGHQDENKASFPAISYDGRFVAFESAADNLVPGDTNGWPDIFVRDRLLGTTERISVTSAGGQGDGPSYHPALSYDGRYIVFSSDATNLVPGDTNGAADVFLKDRQTGVLSRVSVTSTGIQAASDCMEPDISGDGRFVAYHSGASNLATNRAFNTWDIYVYECATGIVEMVSRNNSGVEGDGQSVTAKLSSDGRYVAFNSGAHNLDPRDHNNSSNVFVADRSTHTIEMVDLNDYGIQAETHAFWSGISGNGQYVSFATDSGNLVPSDQNHTTDIYVYDRVNRRLRLASATTAGASGNFASDIPSISPDGHCLAYLTAATDLVSGDTNGVLDVISTCGLEFTLPVPTPVPPSDFWVSRNAWKPASDVPVQIRFSVPTPGRLSLKIYNSAGELVKVLRDGRFASGIWSETVDWDGRNMHEEPVASGIYLIRFENPAGGRTAKLAVIQ